jgi:small subunit ribosomal protein S17
MARRRMTGKVTSNKMMKTVVVSVENSYRHPLYGKVVHRAARFKAHDEKGCEPGDTVRIVESRPISKETRWVVEEILARKKVVELPTSEAELPAPEGETSGEGATHGSN